MATKSPEDLIIRPMKRQDVEAILAIEEESFSFPWVGIDFQNAARNGCFLHVIADPSRNSQPLGYSVFRINPPLVEIHNIAVDKGHRRHGLGRLLVANCLISPSPEDIGQCAAMIAIVTERNVAAQLFFQRCNFVAEEVFYGYFRPQKPDDGYLFVHELKPIRRPLPLPGGHELHRKRLQKLVTT